MPVYVNRLPLSILLGVFSKKSYVCVHVWLDMPVVSTLVCLHLHIEFDKM